MKEDEKLLFKVLVGSQAHGLATPSSDFDYRGVYVVPTAKILSLGTKISGAHHIEAEVDDTSWEVGHFLHLATKCNPTILETFLAPLEETTPMGDLIRSYFPQVWNSNDVMNAFVGYGRNQRKKFLEDKDARPNKYAAAYLRSLVNAEQLLSTGTFTVRVAEHPMGDTILRFKEGSYSKGEVIDTCLHWEDLVKEAFEKNPNKQTDIEAVNELLLQIRKENWL